MVLVESEHESRDRLLGHWARVTTGVNGNRKSSDWLVRDPGSRSEDVSAALRKSRGYKLQLPHPLIFVSSYLPCEELGDQEGLRS